MQKKTRITEYPRYELTEEEFKQKLGIPENEEVIAVRVDLQEHKLEIQISGSSRYA